METPDALLLYGKRKGEGWKKVVPSEGIEREREGEEIFRRETRGNFRDFDSRGDKLAEFVTVCPAGESTYRRLVPGKIEKRDSIPTIVRQSVPDG